MFFFVHDAVHEGLLELNMEAASGSSDAALEKAEEVQCNQRDSLQGQDSIYNGVIGMSWNRTQDQNSAESLSGEWNRNHICCLIMEKQLPRLHRFFRDWSVNIKRLDAASSTACGTLWHGKGPKKQIEI